MGLDKSGSGPRLVISPSAEELVELQLTSYGQVSSAPHYQHLLRDSCDGRLFVNYLEVVFENFGEAGIDHDLLKLLRDKCPMVCRSINLTLLSAEVRMACHLSQLRMP